MAQHRDRLLSELYDSVMQRRHVDDVGSESFRLFYRGVLRLDSLCFKTVVLTDAQFLDGTFFMGCRPDDIDDSFRRPGEEHAPFEIQSRTGDLAGDLLAILRGHGRANLKDVFFSLLPRDVAQRIQPELQKFPATAATAWQDVARIISQAAADASLCDQLLDRWGPWLTGRKPQLPLRQWNTPRFEMKLALAAEALDNGFYKSGTPACDLVRTILTKRDDRNHVEGAYEVAVQRAQGDADTVKTINAVRQWYNYVYNRAAAVQHGACLHCVLLPHPHGTKITDWLQSEVDALAHNTADGSHGQSDCVELPGWFVSWLGQRSGSDFRELVRPNMKALEEYWETGNAKKLRDATRTLVNAAASAPTVPSPPAWIAALRLGVEVSARAVPAAGGFLFGQAFAPPVGGAVGAAVGAGIGHVALRAVDSLWMRYWGTAAKLSMSIIEYGTRYEGRPT